MRVSVLSPCLFRPFSGRWASWISWFPRLFIPAFCGFGLFSNCPATAGCCILRFLNFLFSLVTSGIRSVVWRCSFYGETGCRRICTSSQMHPGDSYLAVICRKLHFGYAWNQKTLWRKRRLARLSGLRPPRNQNTGLFSTKAHSLWLPCLGSNGLYRVWPYSFCMVGHKYSTRCYYSQNLPICDRPRMGIRHNFPDMNLQVGDVYLQPWCNLFGHLYSKLLPIGLDLGKLHYFQTMYWAFHEFLLWSQAELLYFLHIRQIPKMFLVQFFQIKAYRSSEFWQFQTFWSYHKLLVGT